MSATVNGQPLLSVKDLRKHFAIVDAKQRIVGDGEPCHVEPLQRGHLWRSAMRRLSAGREAHFVHAQQFGEFLREAQVAEVNRVERAAEDAEATVHAYSLNRESLESPLRPFQVGHSSFRLS